MGRAGAVLVADDMASHPGGRLAGAEHAVRPGLLRHRRLAAVGWRPRGAPAESLTAVCTATRSRTPIATHSGEMTSEPGNSDATIRASDTARGCQGSV